MSYGSLVISTDGVSQLIRLRGKYWEFAGYSSLFLSQYIPHIESRTAEHGILKFRGMEFEFKTEENEVKLSENDGWIYFEDDWKK